MQFQRLGSFLLLSLVLATGCDRKASEQERIMSMQAEVDSLLSIHPEPNEKQRESVSDLVDAYVAYADDHKGDSLSPAYLFEAARLTAALQDFGASIDLFQRIADDHPEHRLAPRSLLSVAGILDVSLGKTEEAREVYQRLMDDYPQEAEQFGVRHIMGALGKTPEEILEGFRQQTDTMDISEASEVLE